MDYANMIVAAIENAAANVLVGAIVLASFAILIGAVLFFLLAVRGIFRWFTRHTWGDVVVSAGRKALK
jgi:hypothetical protein